MHTIEQQIKAVQKASALAASTSRINYRNCLNSAVQTLVGYEKNEQAAERAVTQSVDFKKCLTMINEALIDGLTIENNDPIHKKIIALLTK